MTVLPARGGATIRQRWPFPSGAKRWIERRQVVEENLVFLLKGIFEVEVLDLEQREVALRVFGRANLARDRVAGAQVEAADLRGRYVNVVRARQVVVVGRPKKAEAVWQALEHAFSVNRLILLGRFLKNREDQILFSQARRILDAELTRQLRKIGDFLLFEFLEMH
jgi:hypothetical protein